MRFGVASKGRKNAAYLRREKKDRKHEETVFISPFNAIYKNSLFFLFADSHYTRLHQLLTQ